MPQETPDAPSPTTARNGALLTQSCLNCEADLTGSYCSGCGQRARTARITFPRLLRSFVDHLISVDSRLLRTFQALVRRPGAFIRAFLLGRRVGYARPVSYYLVVVALKVAASAVLRLPAEMPTDGDLDGSFWDENFLALQIGVAFGLLMLPLAAARRLLHRAAGYSVAEHFVFLLYVLAQSILIVLVVQVALWPFGIPLRGDAEGLAWLTAFSGLVLWASRGFLAEPRWKVALKLIAEFAMLFVSVGVIGQLVQLFASR